MWLSIPGVISFQLGLAPPQTIMMDNEPANTDLESMDNVVEKKPKRKANPLLQHPKLGLR